MSIGYRVLSGYPIIKGIFIRCESLKRKESQSYTRAKSQA